MKRLAYGYKITRPKRPAYHILAFSHKNAIKQHNYPVPTTAVTSGNPSGKEISNALQVPEYKTPRDMQCYIHAGSNAESFLLGLHPHSKLKSHVQFPLDKILRPLGPQENCPKMVSYQHCNVQRMIHHGHNRRKQNLQQAPYYRHYQKLLLEGSF
jgi:hypothetical protein